MYTLFIEMLKLHSQLLKFGSFLEMLGVLEAASFTRMYKKDENMLSNYEKWFEGKFRYEKYHLLLENSPKSEAKIQKRDYALGQQHRKFCFLIFQIFMVKMFCSL